MSYIGKTPTAVPLTSSDITDGIITTAKIADDAITSAKLGTGDMAFPNGNLVFETADKGIYLGVTSATASNLLDDYEQGSYTPIYTGATTTGTSVTGSGRYTKIGNLVHVDFSFTEVTTSGAAGALRITGLPFTSSGDSSVRGSFGGNVRLYNHNLNGNAYYQLTLATDENTNYLIISQTSDDGAWITLEVENGSTIYIEGGITYTATT
jgi:hypothetical protein